MLSAGACKAKGRRLSVRVRDAVLDRFGLSAADVRVTPSGVNGPDIQLSMAAAKRFPFAVEAKNREKFAFRPAWIQAVQHGCLMARDLGFSVHPLVCFSRNRDDVYAILRVGALPDLKVLDFPSMVPLTLDRTIDFFTKTKPFIFCNDIEGNGVFYVDRLQELLSRLPERGKRRG